MNLFHHGTAGALTAATLFFISGCCGVASTRQKDAQIYNEIAAQLNPGGTSYLILNPQNVLTGIERTGTQLYLQFLGMPEPPKDAEKITGAALHAALGWRLSGIEDIQGYGESSVLISEADEAPLFRNRAFLMVRPDSKGVLWALPGRENRPFAPLWKSLPADVDSAFEIDLAPGDACRILAGSDKIAPYLKNAQVTAFLGQTPEELLDGLSGAFTVATIPAPGSDEALQKKHMMLSIPDRNGKLAGLIRKGATLLPGVKAEGDRIEFIPLFGDKAPKARPVAILKDGRVTLYSSVAAEKAFTAPAKKFTETDDFKRFSAGLPGEGIAFSYARENYAELLNLVMEALGQEFRMPETAWNTTRFTVLRRDGNNFLAISNSDIDSNQEAALHRVVAPAAVAAVLVKQYMDKNGGNEPKAEAPDTTGECQIRLEQFKSALAAYAAKHNGTYPAGNGIEGVRELLAGQFLPLEATICPGAADEDAPAADAKSFGYDNSSYVYFGGFTAKSNPKLPLVIDWPLNHKGAVNALLIDGTIEKIELETTSCKRIVGKLQAMYHYNEEEFQNLIKQADALDKMFELE